MEIGELESPVVVQAKLKNEGQQGAMIQCLCEAEGVGTKPLE